ncbi:hypothetical protein [Aquimarina spinulae]|uniref:hypothetical protein n=1 Tax=Aquimarina spinulae TaxID=1192023 RepID=UPI00131F2F4C|nr:hypothetical protein [Aquimarina spinulae]
MKKAVFILILMGISSGIYAQKKIKLEDNSNASNFYFLNDKVGIGTNVPKSQLQIAGGSNNWSESIPGLSVGSIHLDPENSNNHFGSAITFGASDDASNGENAQAGIYVRSDGSYGTKMYFSTTNAYVSGSKTAMTIDHIGKVGIGTNVPKSRLQIAGGSNNWSESIPGLSVGSIHLDPENSNNHFGSAITFGASDDASNGENAQAGIYVRSDGSYGTKMYFSTTNAYVSGSKTAMTIDHIGKVGIGTITTGSHKLAVDGSVGAREIKVEATSWSDFVFETDYTLPTLSEVENHIKEKGHLKDIPSAKEVEKNGILLGAMNAKLLQKIEELTLYTIQQEKEIKQQASEIEQLKFLSNRLSEIEKLIKTKK